MKIKKILNELQLQKVKILQNLENTKKRNEEIENELIEAEKKYNSINQNIKEIQIKTIWIKRK